MTTTLTRKVKHSTLCEIFDNSQTISIRYFEPAGDKFKIIIRHPENTNAAELFKAAVHKAEKH